MGTKKIIIEGSIGSGKTTLINSLKEKLGQDILVCEEPVQIWRDYHGINLLGQFYTAAGHDHARNLQMVILLTLANRYFDQLCSKAKYQIFERSIGVARDIFIKEIWYIL